MAHTSLFLPGCLFFGGGGGGDRALNFKVPTIPAFAAKEHKMVVFVLEKHVIVMLLGFPCFGKLHGIVSHGRPSFHFPRALPPAARRCCRMVPSHLPVSLGVPCPAPCQAAPWAPSSQANPGLGLRLWRGSAAPRQASRQVTQQMFAARSGFCLPGTDAGGSRRCGARAGLCPASPLGPGAGSLLSTPGPPPVPPSPTATGQCPACKMLPIIPVSRRSRAAKAHVFVWSRIYRLTRAFGAADKCSV